MAASPTVLTYWSNDEQTELVVQVGRSRFAWAFIDETSDGVYAVLSGWCSWPHSAPEDLVRLLCHDHAEAVRVIVALAALRGLPITKRPA